MKKRLFPSIVALAALSVAGSAAFYSVFGLSKLFAGASTEVIIMAGSLEFAKLVVASLLYQYWDTINKILKGYLMIACFVLMVITSGGIYGFLSGAYQSTATQSELLDKSLVILEHKQTRFTETKDDLTLEKTQINQSISDLRISLSNPHQVSWYDKNSETVITSSSSSARRALQAELKTTIADRDNLNLKLEAILDSISKTDIALLEKEIDNEGQRELGPLKYLASTTGWPMDKVVNYFLLLIIFVFDPLAIALVVAANMAFAQLTPKRKEEDYFTSRNEHLEKIIEMEPPVGLREDNTTQPSESLKQRVKENQEKLKKIDEDYFSDLEGYIKYTREEDIENLTYPQFIEKHYPKSETTINTYGDDDWATPQVSKEDKEKTKLITSTDELTEEEIDEISREIGKTETTDEPTPINPTEEELEKLEEILEEPKPIEPTKKDLEKLSKALNIKYDDEIGDIDRLTDTTQTLIVKTKKEEDDIKVIKSEDDLEEEPTITVEEWNNMSEKEYENKILTYKGRKK